MPRSPLLLPLSLLFLVGLQAEDGAASPQQVEAKKATKEAFKLGEVTVVVTAKAEVLEQVHTRVTAETFQAFNADTVGSALNLLPGISLSLTSKNETALYVRGHDSRRVPVYLDGIPAYVPYEGQMDFARFSSFDLAEIQVAKGFSSVLFGANTLGGAINLVTRRPGSGFEGDVQAGLSEGAGRKVAANAGSLHDRWYIQAGVSQRETGDFRLSSDFVSNAREDGGRRENSFSEDRKGSLKVGFLPNATDEYVLGYSSQKGERGQPVSSEVRNPARYWRWPQWDKESLYLTTSTSLGSASYLRIRAYHDTYQNTMDMYANAGFQAVTSTSLYDDFTRGASVEFGSTALKGHSLRAVLQTRTDVHREGDRSTAPWKRFEDEGRSLGVEDSFSLSSSLDLSLGAGVDQLRPVASGVYRLPQAKSFTQGQAGLFWKVRPDLQLYVTAARKDRFPTLKDRYSLRFDSYIENPDLQAERALNVDLGARWSPSARCSFEFALFQSDVQDLIQEVKSVSGTKSQMQNIGLVRHTGVELSCGLKPAEWLESGLAYTYLDRENRSQPTLRLTGTPRHRVTGYARVKPSEHWQLQASVEGQDGLWDTLSDKSRSTLRLAGWASASASVVWKPVRGVQAEAGFTNLLDRNYQLTPGFPMPGRSWYANTRYRF